MCVLIGGQPGAGKTRIVAQTHAALPGAVQVVGDDLRPFHPDYTDLLRDDPLRMPDMTAGASGAWVELCIEYAIDQRVPLVVETTLRSAETLQRTAGKLRAGGFSVELKVVAVPPPVSLLGTASRYVRQLEDKGWGRWTPFAAHQAAVAGSAATLATACLGSAVDGVTVVNREGAVLYRGMEHDEVTAAVTRGRSCSSITPSGAVAWVEQLAACAGVLLGDGGHDDALRVLVELARAAPEVERQLLSTGGGKLTGLLHSTCRRIGRHRLPDT
ncbi:Zeta toxin [Quadrisphaera granulorum]|uniref:UDP-N-acetylglucosamine kinase n=1 Tax=Quadrisphaera granulorum TaxID=317664 RepID=A0A316A681_9ACTN|nr:zeta toxin [Quadrisphaera granulorum]SZE97157.1 Zeta toxin [Quadrisphaera granulorum]